MAISEDTAAMAAAQLAAAYATRMGARPDGIDHTKIKKEVWDAYNLFRDKLLNGEA